MRKTSQFRATVDMKREVRKQEFYWRPWGVDVMFWECIKDSTIYSMGICITVKFSTNKMSLAISRRHSSNTISSSMEEKPQISNRLSF
jgi:hypothetical protein